MTTRIWRCANDLFKYCSGEPDWLKEPTPRPPWHTYRKESAGWTQ